MIIKNEVPNLRSQTHFQKGCPEVYQQTEAFGSEQQESDEKRGGVDIEYEPP